ncbi:sugar dehydrogenase complex small subunit [Ewingella americana]|uniref:sugar dehydrogenase complex small subunit n=1 Tax=Ewingella americana TaxID=41202 RepID=UPI00163A8FD0|nr:sugar dehydrogenase complex small subunit [Ewingella americana]QMV53920.1 hypothetical protein GXP68_21790 [Ewingella americana]
MGLKLPPYGLTRRRFVTASAAVAALSLVSPWSTSWAVENIEPQQLFMSVSRVITPAELSPQTGAQLYKALHQSNSVLDPHLQALAKMIAATPGITIELLAEALKAGQHQDLLKTLNSMVAAWYTGIVGNRTYAYQTALMYQPTRDVLSPPSYTRGGPLNWANSQPPTDA